MLFRPLLPIVVFAIAAYAPAQDAQEMLRGAGNALTLHPDGLSLDYKAVVIKTSNQSSNGILDMIMNPMMMLMGALGGMSGGDSKDQPPTALLTALDLTWTKGDTESFFGQTFLVAYKLDFDLSKMATPPKDLSGLDLRLQFIRTDTIASVTPRPDITAIDFVKMLRTPLPKQDSKPSDSPGAVPPG